MKKTTLAPDSFLSRHLLVADPAPLSFKSREGWGGGGGGVAYKDPARPPPPPRDLTTPFGAMLHFMFYTTAEKLGGVRCKPEVMRSTERHKCIVILYGKPG